MLATIRSERKIQPPYLPYINVPTAQGRLVGRKREVREVTRLLSSSRLVTLTGAAGSGKTRLAMQVAASASHNYADGAHWVDLAHLEDAALVSQTVAHALQVTEQPEYPSLVRVLSALRGRQLLLILDNCEQFPRASTRFVEILLATTAVTILVTSREPLNIAGERPYPLGGLPLPPLSLWGDEVDAIRRFDAVKLFVERARAIAPGFEVTEDNAGAVARICRAVGGNPLAIELASARVNTLDPEQIAAELEYRVGRERPATRLISGPLDFFRIAMDWSHDLLSQPEQILLRRLSVFSAGCSLVAAEAVCGGDGDEGERLPELLAKLVNKSLLVADASLPGLIHYVMPDAIRGYARGKLCVSGECSAVRGEHLRYCLQLAEELRPRLGGRCVQQSLDRLEDEYANVRGALAWSLESDHVETGLRIAVALGSFWTRRDYLEEGLVWLKRLLAETDERVSGLTRKDAYACMGLLSGVQAHT